MSSEVVSVKNLIRRLRGDYEIPVNDGAGLLDGKEAFSRKFDTPPICHEAANAIELMIGEHAKYKIACYLCEQDGNDDPYEVLYEGAIKEPWGERWQVYYEDASEIVEIIKRASGEEPEITT